MVESLIQLTHSRIESMQDRLEALTEDAAGYERSGKQLPAGETPPQAEAIRIPSSARPCISLPPTGTASSRSSLTIIFTLPVDTRRERAARMTRTSTSTTRISPRAASSTTPSARCSAPLRSR